MAAPPENTGPPKWLDSNFIQNALKDKFTVNSVQIEDAVSAGENYATVVYRSLVETTTGPISLIIKCMPESEFRAKFLRDGKLMDREVRMYEKTLPMLRGELSHPTFPHCYHVMQDGTRDTLVLADMRPLGYRTRPRQLGLDEAHCRHVLKELAHVHGLSAALRIQQPDVFKSEIQDFYIEEMYSEDKRENTTIFLQTSLRNIAKAIENNLSLRFYPLSKIMTAISENVFDELKNALFLPQNEKELEDRVLVLNHGDCWSNNMLFKYEDDSNVPVGCCLLDFQLSRCGSPTQDLLYLLYTSTTQNTRRKHMDELLQYYLDETLKVIHNCGVANPGSKFYKDLNELKKDMKQNELIGLIVTCFALPAVIANADTAPDINELMSEENFRSPEKSIFDHMYSGPLFCERIAQLLEDFDDLGFFEHYVKQHPQIEGSLNEFNAKTL